MLYLSQAIGRPVRDRQNEPIGKVADLIVALGGQYPPVTGLVVSTDRRRIFLPWSSVESLDGSGARLRTNTIDIDKFRQRPDNPDRREVGRQRMARRVPNDPREVRPRNRRHEINP